MKHVKNIIRGGFMGIGIGNTVNLFFSAIMGRYSPGVPSFIAQFDSEVVAVVLITLTYMLLGIVQEYSSVIMDTKERSLLFNTILHYMVVVLPLFVAAYILHWIESLQGFFFIVLTISIAYFIIWIANYISIRREILKINQSIKMRNQ